VLDVIAKIHREDFVAAAHRQLAFADLCLPLGHDEVMMSPWSRAAYCKRWTLSQPIACSKSVRDRVF
jgi:protein-L-isoaspartate O-methyltransferase